MNDSRDSPRRTAGETITAPMRKSADEGETLLTGRTAATGQTIAHRLAESVQRTTGRTIAAERMETIVWFLPGLLAGGFIYVVYLFTHPYPAFGSGLFLLMAQEVSRQGYHLPVTIPYFARPVPFVYPPLMFYGVALLHDALGIAPLAITRYLPGFVTVVTLGPFYLFVQTLLGSKRKAGIATVILATSPAFLEWHLSAGGVVRAPAMLFVCSGLYTGSRLFERRTRRWLLPSVAFFALTVLTHPVYTVFFVCSYIWLYVVFDRSLAGLSRGVIVGVSGVVLTAPWWMQVAALHGFAVFGNAAGTHSGIGQHLATLFNTTLLALGGRAQANVFDVWLRTVGLTATESTFIVAWYGLIVGAAGYVGIARWHRRSRTDTFLVGWVLLSAFLISEARFVFFIGAILITVAISDLVQRHVTRIDAFSEHQNHLSLAALLVVGTVCLSVGGAYTAGALDTHADSHSLPAFIDDDDVAAMQWVHGNVAPSAKFVVLGDAAEWFPYFTHRRILVGPWGVEWKGKAAYQRQVHEYSAISQCKSKRCLETTLGATGVRPEYIYLPTNGYTVRGKETASSPTMHAELVRDQRYTPVYRNDGVLILKVRHDGRTRSHHNSGGGIR